MSTIVNIDHGAHDLAKNRITIRRKEGGPYGGSLSL